jgi:hypothetical protein
VRQRRLYSHTFAHAADAATQSRGLVTYILNRLFEWDPRKASSNAEKHGVSFGEAVTVFLDADAL